MKLLKKIFTRNSSTLIVNKEQKELLEFFMLSKADFEDWLLLHPSPKISFRFFYPTAIDFYYGDFKLFTAYFKKTSPDHLELLELKISEANLTTIRCRSWNPFEEVIIKFLTSLEETKKVTLFEKRRLLFEYETLCTKQRMSEEKHEEYLNTVSSLLPR